MKVPIVLRWVEVGRAELMRARGVSYRAIEEAGFSLPVVEAWCRYLQVKPTRSRSAGPSTASWELRGGRYAPRKNWRGC